jgi:hypothetical protein
VLGKGVQNGNWHRLLRFACASNFCLNRKVTLLQFLWPSGKLQVFHAKANASCQIKQNKYRNVFNYPHFYFY